MTATEPRLKTILREIASALRARGVAHALAGGMAMAAHGFPRATKDLDFLLAATDAAAVDALMKQLGFAAANDAHGFVRYVRHPMLELPELTEWVDFLLAQHAIGLELLAEAQRHPVRFEGAEYPIVSREGLIAMKLLALSSDPRRLTDRADVNALLRDDARLDRSRARGLCATLGPEVLELFDRVARESSDEVREPGTAGFDRL